MIRDSPSLESNLKEDTCVGEGDNEERCRERSEEVEEEVLLVRIVSYEVLHPTRCRPVVVTPLSDLITCYPRY